MMDQPQLLIVAGPNGAGKSTFSRDLSPQGAIIFDPDIETAKIQSRYQDLPGESIQYALYQFFLDLVETVLKNRLNFVIETNFRDHGLIETIERFKADGYAINMIYLALNNVAQSIERVNQRVRGGGHSVDKESIRFNYNEGLENLRYFALRFDNLEVIDASGEFPILRSLLSIKASQVKYIGKDIPEWIKPRLTDIANRVNGQSQDRRMGPRR